MHFDAYFLMVPLNLTEPQREKVKKVAREADRGGEANQFSGSPLPPLSAARCCSQLPRRAEETVRMVSTLTRC
jgi:hypothetical protein